jgi:hypothetical protein
MFWVDWILGNYTRQKFWVGMLRKSDSPYIIPCTYASPTTLYFSLPPPRRSMCGVVAVPNTATESPCRTPRIVNPNLPILVWKTWRSPRKFNLHIMMFVGVSGLILAIMSSAPMIGDNGRRSLSCLTGFTC